MSEEIAARRAERVKLRELMDCLRSLPVREPRCIIGGTMPWGATFYLTAYGGFAGARQRAYVMSVVQAKGLLLHCPLLLATAAIIPIE
jgi:hypothetical protein